MYRDPRGSLWVVYMSFLEVYGDPRGSYGVIYMRFGKCMGSPVKICGVQVYSRSVLVNFNHSVL